MSEKSVRTSELTSRNNKRNKNSVSSDSESLSYSDDKSNPTLRQSNARGPNLGPRAYGVPRV